jgi:hypothetical protein
MQANRLRLSSLSTSNVVAAQQMDRFVNAGVQLLHSTFPTVNALAVCVVITGIRPYARYHATSDRA